MFEKYGNFGDGSHNAFKAKSRRKTIHISLSLYLLFSLGGSIVSSFDVSLPFFSIAIVDPHHCPSIFNRTVFARLNILVQHTARQHLQRWRCSTGHPIHQRTIAGRVPDHANRMLQRQNTQIIVHGMADEHPVEEQRLDIALDALEIITVDNVLRSNAADGRPIVDDWLARFNVSIHQHVAHFVDDGHPSDHVVLRLETDAHHFAVHRNALRDLDAYLESTKKKSRSLFFR